MSPSLAFSHEGWGYHILLPRSRTIACKLVKLYATNRLSFKHFVLLDDWFVLPFLYRIIWRKLRRKLRRKQAIKEPSNPAIYTSAKYDSTNESFQLIRWKFLGACRVYWWAIRWSLWRTRENGGEAVFWSWSASAAVVAVYQKSRFALLGILWADGLRGLWVWC